mgnify:CR=1 FL=1
MPFICATTGEMKVDGLEGADVSVETSPKSLVSHSVVKAPSDKSGQVERWVWKEERDLSPEEKAQFLTQEVVPTRTVVAAAAG